MSTSLNPNAVVYAKHLIREGKIKNDSGQWRQHNPDASHENAFLQKHEIADYANWHLGLDMSKGENAKSRYKFPYGDFTTLHRDGLLAAKERAAQQGCRDIENAADELLQMLEEETA